MSTEQQGEALGYFNKAASEWNDKATKDNPKKVNVIQQRNSYVVHAIQQRKATRSVLDVGCGTGDLVCDIAKAGFQATGVDFASDMIEIARAKAASHKLANTSFHSASIFDFPMQDSAYDVISANGFIEYISYSELDQFFALSNRVLEQGGSLVFGSRNRLFNMTSYNAYTRDELKTDDVLALLKEAIAFADNPTLAALHSVEPAALQDVDTQHANTGIGVSTRYQFTPVQLMRMAERHGFIIEQIFPIHIHGVPTEFKSVHPEVHTSISNLLQSYAGTSLAFIPYSSAFMINARKA